MINYARKFNHPVTTVIIMASGIFGIIFGVQAYPKTFKVTVALEQQEKIDPGESLEVKFSEPMLTRMAQEKISIFPAEFVKFEWKDSQTLAVSPQNFWQPGGAYSLKIQGVRSRLLTTVDQDFVFEVADYPKVADFYPESGAKDVLLDIEDPITIFFDQPLENFKTRFVIRPEQELASELTPDGRKIKLLPKEELKRGQKYSLDIYLRYKDEPADSDRLIYSASFETKPLEPVEWEKNFDLRLEQAKKYTQARITSGKYIDLNLKSQVMVIFENGVSLDAYLVSSGKRGMETPQGTFHIANKTPRAWSKRYGLFMPYWMALVSSGDFGIHELPEWPGGFKEGRAHLGTPVSHGCVRLGVGPAQRVYEWTPIGTPVVIHL